MQRFQKNPITLILKARSTLRQEQILRIGQADSKKERFRNHSTLENIKHFCNLIKYFYYCHTHDVSIQKFVYIMLCALVWLQAQFFQNESFPQTEPTFGWHLSFVLATTLQINSNLYIVRNYPLCEYPQLRDPHPPPLLSSSLMPFLYYTHPQNAPLSTTLLAKFYSINGSIT